MRQLNAMSKLKSRYRTASASAVRDVTHGRTFLSSIIHHAPSTTSSCQASGLKAQWLFGHAGTVQPKTCVVGNMVKKYPPQRDTSAGIYSQVAARAFELRQLADQWLGGGFSVAHLVPLERWADVGVFGVRGSHSETYDCAENYKPA